MAHKHTLPRFEGDKYKTDEENLELLKDSIRQLRSLVFYDPEQTAEYFGLNRTTVIRYESGNIKKPPYGYMLVLALRLVEGERFETVEQSEIKKSLMQELNKIVKFCPGYNNEQLLFDWEQVKVSAEAYLNSIESKKSKNVSWPVVPPPIPQEQMLEIETEERFLTPPITLPIIPDAPAVKRERGRKLFVVPMVISGVALVIIFLVFNFLNPVNMEATMKVLNPTPDPLPGKGVVVVEALALSPATAVNSGQVITATFRVRNTGTEALFLRKLVASVRGPDACVMEWNSPNVDFPAVTNITLQPGEDYLYRQSRSFEQSGYYFAEPTILTTNNVDGGIWPWSRVGFEVRDSRKGRILAGDCLLGLDEITLSDNKVSIGQPLTVSYKVKNNSGTTLIIKQVAAVVHGADYQNYALASMFFPASTNITLQPGEVYTYSQTRVINRPGEYWLEFDIQISDTQWKSVWPYKRVYFRVVDDP